MRRVVKAVAAVTLVLLGLAILSASGFALVIWSREPLAVVQSTTHASISRKECLHCHAPIAEEWRQSYHAVSLTGPQWQLVRELGYLKTFDRVRKRCVDCHAPANVLDLAVASASAAHANSSLGVECTPNLLREPRGVIPSARADDVDLGVDCTSCHVSKAGIRGSGSRRSDVHETVADARFQAPATTSERLCRTCHAAAVAAWEQTRYARDGITCLECHMPVVNAPSVAGGPDRSRRSHRFLADKDRATLEHALHASLDLVEGRKARLRIVNDRVGHFFPSGGNWVFVRLSARDPIGRTRAEKFVGIGREEALILDFWPFASDRRLGVDESRDIVLDLPEGHGTIEADVRYHDFMRANRTLATFTKEY